MGVSHQVLWLIILVSVLAVIFSKTRLGVWIRAVGSNERSARMMGIPTQKVTVQVFVISGLLSGFAGVIQVAQSNQAVPQSGDSVMLTALAGAIVGGVALTGGRGGVVGPLLGGLTLLVISLGFVMMGVVEYWTNILIAIAVIFTAYAFTRLESLRLRKARKS
jgi:ribose/xylose/arabinose/galactoside ABC-type transport system permease subunit